MSIIAAAHQSLLGVATNPLAVSLRAKILLWSDMSETSGSTAVERIEGNTGTYVNMGSYTVTGPFGNNAKRFGNFDDSRLAFPQTTLNQRRSDFTVMVVFKRDTTDVSGYLYRRAGTGDSAAQNAEIYATNADVDSKISFSTVAINGTASPATGHKPFAANSLYDGNYHQLCWGYTRTGALEAATTSTTKFHVDGALNTTYTNLSGDNGGLYHGAVGTPCTSSGTTFSEYNVGGKATGSNSHRGPNSAIAQFIVIAGLISDAEAAYLYNGGAFKAWAAFNSESGG